MPIHVLAVSDAIDERIHSATLRQRMPSVQIVFSCGDLPARYLEFLVDALDRPLYYVLGNHAEELTRKGERGLRYLPLGCIDVGGKVRRDPASGLLIAGLPGSPKYNGLEPEQYTEFEMHLMVLRMAPRLLWNRWRHGRALDVLITHAPPRDVNDAPDKAHRGFVAVRRFLRWFRPAYHLHGHVHLYDRSQSCQVTYDRTLVVNVYPYRELHLDIPALRQPVPAPAPPREPDPAVAAPGPAVPGPAPSAAGSEPSR
jgi:hypothetical protein